MNYDNQGGLDGIVSITGDNIETSSITVDTATIRNLSYSNCSGTQLQGNTIIGNVSSFNTVNGTFIFSDISQNFIHNTLYKLTTGRANTFFGNIAGANITTGSYNSGFGTGVLRLITNAGYNTANGYFSLYNSTSGSYNTAIGANSGRNNSSGSYNTFLGASTDISGVFSSSTAIGANAKITGSNQLVLGTITETTYIAGNAFINGTIQNNTSIDTPLLTADNITASNSIQAITGGFSTITGDLSGNVVGNIQGDLSGNTSGTNTNYTNGVFSTITNNGNVNIYGAINSYGYVGVNGRIPTNPLDVSGIGVFSSLSSISLNPSLGSYGVIQAYNTGNINAKLPLYLNAYGGNVGIGSTTSTHKLYVNGTTRITGELTTNSITNTGNITTTGIFIGDVSGTNGAFTNITNTTLTNSGTISTPSITATNGTITTITGTTANYTNFNGNISGTTGTLTNITNTTLTNSGTISTPSITATNRTITTITGTTANYTNFNGNISGTTGTLTNITNTTLTNSGTISTVYLQINTQNNPNAGIKLNNTNAGTNYNIIQFKDPNTHYAIGQIVGIPQTGQQPYLGFGRYGYATDLCITANGQIGIGKVPSSPYLLDINGSLNAGSLNTGTINAGDITGTSLNITGGGIINGVSIYTNSNGLNLSNFGGNGFVIYGGNGNSYNQFYETNGTNGTYYWVINGYGTSMYLNGSGLNVKGTITAQGGLSSSVPLPSYPNCPTGLSVVNVSNSGLFVVPSLFGSSFNNLSLEDDVGIFHKIDGGLPSTTGIVIAPWGYGGGIRVSNSGLKVNGDITMNSIGSNIVNTYPENGGQFSTNPYTSYGNWGGNVGYCIASGFSSGNAYNNIYAMDFISNSGTANYSCWNFYSLSQTSSTATCWNTIYNGGFAHMSDRTTKQNIKDLNTKNSLDKILSLKPKNYQYIEDPSNQRIGFISQEVAEISPLATVELPYQKDESGNTITKKALNYTDILVHSTGAIQELYAKIKALEEKVEYLNSQVANKKPNKG